MLPRTRYALLALALLAMAAGTAPAADLTATLKQGTLDLKSVGPLAFGPEGILFMGDPQGAAIFAVATGDTTPTPAGPYKIESIDEKVGGLLGIDAKSIRITDLAVNPASGRAYLAVMRGQGPNATPVVVRTDNKGKIEEFALKDVKFAKTNLPNTNERQRQEAITHMAYLDGKLIVAGMSNEEFQSRLRVIPFPFTETDKGAGIRIFHGAHGKFETQAPVRTFVPFEINGEAHLLAAYTCTPLVKIPIAQLKPGEHVQGTTVAELGNGNRPLDMIAYQKNGKDYLLLANSSRGMMKITTENVDKIAGITKPVERGGKAGLTYETIAELKNVIQMDKLDKENALVLLRSESGTLNLQSVALP